MLPGGLPLGFAAGDDVEVEDLVLGLEGPATGVELGVVMLLVLDSSPSLGRFLDPFGLPLFVFFPAIRR